MAEFREGLVQEKPKKRRIWLIVIIVLVVLCSGVVVCGGGYLLYENGDSILEWLEEIFSLIAT